MSFKELFLAAILHWPSAWHAPGETPETPEEYQQRLQTIVDAVSLEAQQVAVGQFQARELTAATLTVWYGETRFAHGIHARGESRFSQDEGRARCLGQIHVSGLVARSEWEALVGADLEATRRCARATLRVLLAMARYCEVHAPSVSGMARVFAAYGSGKGCRPSTQSTERARRWQRLVAATFPTSLAMRGAVPAIAAAR
jgi:hypothetical protein